MPGQTCRFGYCLAPIPPDRTHYCSAEHEKAARSKRTADAIAKRAAEEFYIQISRGHAKPIRHQGWVSDSAGVVLDGSVVIELRALIASHRAAMADLIAFATRPGASTAEVSRRIGELTRKVDKPLLATLDRVLPRPGTQAE